MSVSLSHISSSSSSSTSSSNEENDSFSVLPWQANEDDDGLFEDSIEPIDFNAALTAAIPPIISHPSSSSSSSSSSNDDPFDGLEEEINKRVPDYFGCFYPSRCSDLGASVPLKRRCTACKDMYALNKYNGAYSIVRMITEESKLPDFSSIDDTRRIEEDYKEFAAGVIVSNDNLRNRLVLGKVSMMIYEYDILSNGDVKSNSGVEVVHTIRNSSFNDKYLNYSVDQDGKYTPIYYHYVRDITADTRVYMKRCAAAFLYLHSRRYPAFYLPDKDNFYKKTPTPSPVVVVKCKFLVSAHYIETPLCQESKCREEYGFVRLVTNGYDSSVLVCEECGTTSSRGDHIDYVHPAGDRGLFEEEKASEIESSHRHRLKNQDKDSYKQMNRLNSYMSAIDAAANTDSLLTNPLTPLTPYNVHQNGVLATELQKIVDRSNEIMEAVFSYRSRVDSYLANPIRREEIFKSARELFQKVFINELRMEQIRSNRSLRQKSVLCTIKAIRTWEKNVRMDPSTRLHDIAAFAGAEIPYGPIRRINIHKAETNRLLRQTNHIIPVDPSIAEQIRLRPMNSSTGIPTTKPVRAKLQLPSAAILQREYDAMLVFLNEPITDDFLTVCVSAELRQACKRLEFSPDPSTENRTSYILYEWIQTYWKYLINLSHNMLINVRIRVPLVGLDSSSRKRETRSVKLHSVLTLRDPATMAAAIIYTALNEKNCSLIRHPLPSYIKSEVMRMLDSQIYKGLSNEMKKVVHNLSPYAVNETTNKAQYQFTRDWASVLCGRGFSSLYSITSILPPPPAFNLSKFRFSTSNNTVQKPIALPPIRSKEDIDELTEYRRERKKNKGKLNRKRKLEQLREGVRPTTKENKNKMELESTSSNSHK